MTPKKSIFRKSFMNKALVLAVAGLFSATLKTTAFCQQTGSTQSPASNSQPATSSSSTSSSNSKSSSSSSADSAANSNDNTPKRVLWIFPSFNVTNDENAPPLTPKEKLDIAVRTVFDPVTLTESAIKAGVYQSEDAPPGYGLGYAGYARRIGASYADMASMRMLGLFAFPVLLHQDPRYFRKNHGSAQRRMLYALSQLFVTRTDSGHQTFNASNVLANMGSAGLSCTYYPAGNCHFGIFMANLGWGFLTRGVGNGLREFWPDIHRRFTRRKQENVSPPENP
jgi:hypothetical protein